MKTLANIIPKFDNAKVLVIGDLILDQYIWGTVDRVSPEAPVPVVWAEKRTYVPGGAANVANNISSLGGHVELVGVTGSDEHAKLLMQGLKERRIGVKGIFADESRRTILKTRVLAGHQQVVRVDWEDREPLSQELNKKIISFIKKNIADYDAIIIEDYGKGVVNRAMLEDLIKLADENKKIIAVDPKEDHFQYYRKATTITPNRKELENAIRNLKIKDKENKLKLDSDRLFTDSDIDLAAFEIMEYLELESMLVTLGEQGMKLFEEGRHVTHIPTQAQAVFDVSGAGDTVISVFTLALAAGAKKLEAAYIANYAAGIVVGKVGTAVTTKEEILKRIK